MWQEHERERDLCGVGAEVAPAAPEMAGPGNAARVHCEASCHVQVNGKRNDEKNEERPKQRRAGKQSARSHEPQKQRRRDEAATKIVENLPASDQRYRVADLFAVAVRNARKQPANDLPITAYPSMRSLGISFV